MDLSAVQGWAVEALAVEGWAVERWAVVGWAAEGWAHQSEVALVDLASSEGFGEAPVRQVRLGHHHRLPCESRVQGSGFRVLGFMV